MLGTAEQGIGGRGSGNDSKAKAEKSDFEDGRVRAVTSRRSKEHHAGVSRAGSVMVTRDGEDQQMVARTW